MYTTEIPGRHPTRPGPPGLPGPVGTALKIFPAMYWHETHAQALPRLQTFRAYRASRCSLDGSAAAESGNDMVMINNVLPHHSRSRGTGAPPGPETSNVLLKKNVRKYCHYTVLGTKTIQENTNLSTKLLATSTSILASVWGCRFGHCCTMTMQSRMCCGDTTAYSKLKCAKLA